GRTKSSGRVRLCERWFRPLRVPAPSEHCRSAPRTWRRGRLRQARSKSGNSATIGLLWPGDAPPASPRIESFRQGLRALGLVEGQNVVIELRYAQRGPEQLPPSAKLHSCPWLP